jgi:cysteinyl-tRNA synthetase
VHPVEEVIPEEIIKLVEQRQQARKEKRWQDADSLRLKILEAGFEIEDTAQGPRLKSHNIRIEN